MRVISQWKFDRAWGIALISVFRTEHFCGFTILGICFEWPRTELAKEIHAKASIS